MGKFLDPLEIRHIGERRWVLIANLRYQDDSGAVHVIPKGTVTDLASIPGFARTLFPVDGVYAPSAVLHDFLTGGSVDKLADRLFLEAMKSQGVHPLRRYPMYWVVSLATKLRGSWVHRAYRYCMYWWLKLPRTLRLVIGWAILLGTVAQTVRWYLGNVL